ncbi:MAG: peptidylprolyl isomerase [Thermodesulfobacteriota bacterium]
MYRLVLCYLLLTLLMIGSVEAASNKTLVTINDTKYTTQDYRDWWGIWQDPGMVFPPDPQGFIDYLLFVEEGRQMEYDLTPEYQRKLKVFLTVRALSALKTEEVDSKIKITEKQIRAYFANNYAPIWSMQILTYADQAEAQAAADDLQPFNGQKAGRLVFADRAGVAVEAGGPLNYDELAVDPATISKTKNEHWLPVITKLQKWYVSEPFFLESQDKYVVIRMDDINEDPGDEALEKRRQLIRRKLARQAGGRLTAELMRRLKKEYHVEIDEELLAKVKLQDDYSEEILKKSVVKMDGMAFSVGLLIQNMKDQLPLRSKLPEEQLKRLVVNAFISQTLTNNEALSRHYEDRPPLKALYDFYSDNSLRKALESGIKKRIKVSSEEVKNYYDNNPSLYSESAKISYAVIQGDVDLMNKISAAISRGDDFFDQAQAYSLDAKIKTVAVDKIRPILQVELAKLEKGEIGGPFAFGAGRAVVKLLKRVEGKRASLEQVRGKIKETVTKEKFNAAKAVYLEKLRSRAKIVVNKGVWKKLKKEYVK